MKLKKSLRMFAVMAAAMLGLASYAQNANFHITPVPQTLTPGSGTFTVDAKTQIVVPKAAAEVGTMIAQKISQATGYSIPVTTKKTKGTKNIVLVLSKKVQGSEAYELDVTTDGVTATASTPQGLFYAMQTFLQLLPHEIESFSRVSGVAWTAPACHIADAPRFGYRGVLMDVCRHFFTTLELKKEIDALALLKINTIHLHLTEDQGWRVEIKKYPELTKVGAYRTDRGKKYGGYYTQEELKDLVRYAAQRFITIIPEFEMPGHELAAIATYPWLACNDDKVEPRPIWGVEDIVMCPGKESTFKFLEDVVDELVEIFPSKLFHIGGDEAPRKHWATCPLCQKKADELGLKAEEGRSREAQLQSYVVGRMEKYLNKYGKTIIGWDEILEGGNLNKSAVVMSWRGEKGGIAAANAGHNVIMTPNTYLYVDYFQGDARISPRGIGGNLPLEKTYSFNPVSKEIEAKGMGKYVLGAQANLWTEYVNTIDLFEYRLYPRLVALSELSWSPTEKKDFTDFCRRLDNDMAYRLDAHGINYYIPQPEQPYGSCDFEAFTDRISIPFRTDRPARMVYTLDGTKPTPQSAVYTKPLEFDKTTTLKIATVLPSGKMSPVRTIRVEKQSLSSAVPVSKESLKPGLDVKYVEGSYYKTEELSAVTDWKTTTIEKLSQLRGMKVPHDYSCIATGYLNIPEDGVYHFASNHAEVWVDGTKVVDTNNNVIKAFYRGGSSKALAAGLHPFKVVFLGHNADGRPTYWDDGNVQIRLGQNGNARNIDTADIFH